jgi:imidazolonepropionase-like amidohydrolase
MTECGFSTGEALEAATRVAADAAGLSDRLGTLTEGKLADIIVVTGDPLADITIMANGANIQWVVKGGAVVKRPTGPVDRT